MIFNWFDKISKRLSKKDENLVRLNIDDIKVPKLFEESRPRPEKLILKTRDILSGKNMKSVVINSNLYIMDGYCTYLILKALGHKTITCKIIK